MDLIGRVQAGELDPRNIAADDRRSCVAYLSAEGYSVPEIAKILRTCDRTVHRDRERLRADQALEPSESLIPQIVGQLAAEAGNAIQRLRRLGRDKDAPHAARVEAERAAWTVMREFVQSLQRLGYLPLAVPSLRADVTHRVGAANTDQELAELDELSAELDRLVSIQHSAGIERPELSTGIQEVKSVLLRLEAGSRLEQLNRDIITTSTEDPSDEHQQPDKSSEAA